LNPQIHGGSRDLKKFERALRSVGALPESHFIVPGAAAKMDAYGNMDRGQIIQILAYFRSFPEAGYRANTTAKGRARLARTTLSRQGFAYFVGAPAGGKLPLGIWQRFNLKPSAIRPVMIFVKSVLYSKRLDFEY